VGHLDRLGHLLRPAGGGIYTVSTGRAAQIRLQRALYGAEDGAAIEEGWRRELGEAARARVAILGVPSDCGAGLVRGAAFGPSALRLALLERRPHFRAWAQAAGVVDVGDVAVVPHLLHDEMLSDAQKDASRGALFPHAPDALRKALPVSPLSIAEHALDLLFQLNPELKVLVLGGDHSVAWPVAAALSRRERAPWAIVHADAHTDLLPERLGVRYCFATWAYHANERLGRGGRLVQVGIRASGRPRDHWEATLGVRQFWAEEVAARGDAAVIDDIVAHLEARGIERVYFSNDIDATDAGLAPATGTPEPGGLAAGFVPALLDRLAAGFDLCAVDLMEVAPPIGHPEESRRTTELGATYLLASLDAMLRTRDR
jgi:agmatinase